MINKLLILAILFVASWDFGFAQVTASFKNSSIVGEKWTEVELVIPVEIELKNDGDKAVKVTVEVKVDESNSGINSGLQLGADDFKKVEVRNSGEKQLEKKSTSTVFSYLVVKKDMEKVNKEVAIKLTITTDGNSSAGPLSKITLKRANDITYTLSDYLGNPDLRLKYVSKVESNNHVLTIYGYKQGICKHIYKCDQVAKVNVALGAGQVFAVSEWSLLWNINHWRPAPIALTTIPFKVRPKLEENGRTYQSTASAGLTNVGFNIDLAKYQIDRYFVSGRKSTHKFSLGFWAAPGVEEMDSVFTEGFLKDGEKSKQFVVSTGFTVTYSYNGITFSIVPIGWDASPTTVGDEWVYDGKRWFGFGIGINPIILATVLNK